LNRARACACPHNAIIEELVNGHYGSLYRYAYRLSGSSQKPKTAPREVFPGAGEMSQLRDVNRARAWLFTILERYLHKIRDRKNANALPLEERRHPDRASEPLPAIDPQRLQEALDQLPELFGRRSSFFISRISLPDIAIRWCRSAPHCAWPGEVVLKNRLCNRLLIASRRERRA